VTLSHVSSVAWPLSRFVSSAPTRRQADTLANSRHTPPMLLLINSSPSRLGLARLGSRGSAAHAPLPPARAAAAAAAAPSPRRARLARAATASLSPSGERVL
jgi:hypothetical protein